MDAVQQGWNFAYLRSCVPLLRLSLTLSEANQKQKAPSPLLIPSVFLKSSGIQSDKSWICLIQISLSSSIIIYPPNHLNQEWLFSTVFTKNLHSYRQSVWKLKNILLLRLEKFKKTKKNEVLCYIILFQISGLIFPRKGHMADVLMPFPDMTKEPSGKFQEFLHREKTFYTFPWSGSSMSQGKWKWKQQHEYSSKIFFFLSFFSQSSESAWGRSYSKIFFKKVFLSMAILLVAFICISALFFLLYIAPFSNSECKKWQQHVSNHWTWNGSREKTLCGYLGQ